MRLFARFVGPLRVLAAAAAAVGIAHGAGVRLNLSPSLPEGLYHLRSGAPDKGDLVAACLPLEIAALARARGYLGPGCCPGGSAPVLKIVGAVADDVVELSDGVYVNGDLLQPLPPANDRLGRPLSTFPAARVQLGADEVWLSSPSPHSWDSRYFGPVSSKNVLGLVRPLALF